ncbi:MAG: PD-(D/E)XK nuclease family protein [Planctomycetaceae bacterium]
MPPPAPSAPGDGTRETSRTSSTIRSRAAAGTIVTFVERVRAERSQLTSLQDVIDRIEDLVADGPGKQEFDTLSIDAMTGGAVRIMNLHKVKGLEAHVVFLCDENGPKRDRNPTWHITRSSDGVRGYLRVFRTGAFGRDGGTLAAPMGWEAHESTENRYREAEYLRLKYVAGTRPGTCLVTSIFENADGEVTGGWHELADDIGAVANLPELEPHAAAERARSHATTQQSVDDAAVADARQSAAERLGILRAPTFGTVTPRDLLTEPAERLRHSGRGLGQDWGTIIHRLLELSIGHLPREGTPLDLEAAATSILLESDLSGIGIDTATLARRATTLVEHIRESDIWRRIASSPERYVEVPFSITVAAGELPEHIGVVDGPGNVADRPMHGSLADRSSSAHASPPVRTDGQPVLIRGQIDAVFRDDARPPRDGMSDWVIVDWKTTSVVESDISQLVEHYRPQLRLYARCWATGLSPRPG